MIARRPLPRPLESHPFTAEQGRDAGLSASRLRARDIHTPFRGVKTTTPPVSLAERCAALQVGMPTDAFFCGITAALLMRVPLSSRLQLAPGIHVAVPAPRRALTTKGVIGHKFQVVSGQVRMWHGLRISTPERMWCELGASLSIPDLVAAGDYLIHWESPITSKANLRAALDEHPGRIGRTKLEIAFELLDERSESRRESHLRVILVQGGLTGLVANLPITTIGGFGYRADFAFPARKVLVEYQSDYHRNPEQFRKDMTRISRLQADGWILIQVNSDDLRNPAELAARIRQVLDSRPMFA